MRIITATDFHKELECLSKILEIGESSDVILFAGDFSTWGDASITKRMLEEIEFSPTKVYLVPGNMDNPTLFENCKANIHGKVIRIGNASLLGLGGSNPTPFNTPNEFSESSIKEMLDKLSDELRNEDSILLSHTPPFNTKADENAEGMHVGSKSVREFIHSKEPKLVICGHIHEARCIDRVGRGTVVNPGAAQNGHYAVIDFGKEIKVELKKL